MSKGNEYLKPICENPELFIETCDGSKGLDTVSGLFDWVDPTVDSLATKIPTGRIKVEAYEILQRANFMRLFISLGRDGADLFFTPHQVREFISNNMNWLREGGCDTYLFFKSAGGIFGAYSMFAPSGRRELYFTTLDKQPFCPSNQLPRLVVPFMA